MKKFDINPFYPCPNAKEWYNQQPSTEDAWNNCHRGDWLLWIAVKLGVDNHLLVLTAAYCAKTVYHLMTDERSKDAVVAAINYGRGKISEDELNAAAAHAAYAATDATDAFYAAYAAAHAATNAAAYAAANATDAYAARAAYAVVRAAAYAAANATDAYAADAERKNQQQTADICRKYLTNAVFNKLKQLS